MQKVTVFPMNLFLSFTEILFQYENYTENELKELRAFPSGTESEYTYLELKQILFN